MDLFDWLNTPAFELLGKPVPYSDLFGNICALATVVLALRRNILSWPVQILGSILLFSASISAGLGGNASRQVVIIVAAVWGWTQWKKSKEASGEVIVRWASWKERGLLVAGLLHRHRCLRLGARSGRLVMESVPRRLHLHRLGCRDVRTGAGDRRVLVRVAGRRPCGHPPGSGRRARVLRSRLPRLPHHGHPRPHRLVETLEADDLGTAPLGHRHRPRPRSLNCDREFAATVCRRPQAGHRRQRLLGPAARTSPAAPAGAVRNVRPRMLHPETMH